MLVIRAPKARCRILATRSPASRRSLPVWNPDAFEPVNAERSDFLSTASRWPDLERRSCPSLKRPGLPEHHLQFRRRNGSGKGVEGLRHPRTVPRRHWRLGEDSVSSVGEGRNGRHPAASFHHTGVPGRLHAGGAGGHGGAGAAQRGPALGHGLADRQARGALPPTPAHRVPAARRADPPHLHPGPGRPRRQLRGRRDSRRPAAPVDPGHRAGHQAPRLDAQRPAQRGLRAALGGRRVDVRRRGRPRSGRHDVARQPAQPQARHRQGPAVPRGVGGGRRRDERLGPGFLRPPHHRGLADPARLHHEALPVPRAPPRRPPRAGEQRDRLLGVDRGPGALRGEQPRAAARRGLVGRPLPPQDPDRGGGGALERHDHGARAPPRDRGRHRQGLRPRGADRGVLPAHGDPRRAVAALRGVQHGALGLHQQRLRRALLGPGVHQPQHRRDRHDVRLHAQLRGPRAPGRQHARPQRPLRPLAGRHGDQHPRRHARGRRRRA